MLTGKGMPSPSAIFSTYASITTTMMLARSMANELLPHPIRGYLFSTFHRLFKTRSPLFTLVIEESTGICRNQLYDAAEAYLCSKVSPDTVRLKISKTPKDKSLRITLENGEKVVDLFDGMELRWQFVSMEGDYDNAQSRGRSNGGVTSRFQKKLFELSFHKKHKDAVMGSYVPHVLQKAKEINDDHRALKMHTLGSNHCYGGSIMWDSVNLEHPSTFDTLAMEPDLKQTVMEDLNRFVKMKEFYRKIGRAWKRGYLLYGPPGTGKSSLVAAMANYLKFDVYDLQLGNIVRDSDLRKVLLGTGNRSILVIEDIDCSVDIPDRRQRHGNEQNDRAQLSLSGLLNFIDGLWSSCGDERIIVFTTNHKDRLDPALLRPGRMDMHIHMSYCTFRGFKMLASNYLGIGGCSGHRLYPEIEALIDASQVTPAQVAEELLKGQVSEEEALQGVVKLLKRKKLEIEEAVASPDNKAKRLKGTTCQKKRVVRKRYI